MGLPGSQARAQLGSLSRIPRVISSKLRVLSSVASAKRVLTMANPFFPGGTSDCTLVEDHKEKVSQKSVLALMSLLDKSIISDRGDSISWT